MSYSIEVREKAIYLRKKGYSLKEISEMLVIAKSTSSLWLSYIKLNLKAQTRLKKRRILGQYKAMETAKIKRVKLKESFNKIAKNSLKKLGHNIELYKLLCSFLFWTEGGRSTDSYVYFINSDPKMVSTFLKLLRSAFNIEEKKVRAMLQIHEYHEPSKLLKFWSRLTKIPLSRFSKSYIKPHTGKRLRQNYMGSIRIRYYDYRIALELRSFYNTFVETIGA